MVENNDLRDRLVGCVYGAIVGDLFRGVDQKTMQPIISDTFSLDVQDFIRYMNEYAGGAYPVVEYDGKGVVTLLPDMLVFKRSMLNSALGKHTGRFYQQPYLAACQAIYDTIFMNQGRTTWIRLNGPQNGSDGLTGLCDEWNVAVALAREAYAFPDSLVLAQNAECRGVTVGMLAGARFGLHSIPGKWLSAVPVEIKGIVGKFVNMALDSDKKASEVC